MMTNFECLLLTQRKPIEEIIASRLSIKDDKAYDCEFSECTSCEFKNSDEDCLVRARAWLNEESEYFNRLGVFAIPINTILEISKSEENEKGETVIRNYVGYYVGFREDKEGKVHHYINKSTIPANFFPTWSEYDIPFELSDIVSVLKIGTCVEV